MEKAFQTLVQKRVVIDTSSTLTVCQIRRESKKLVVEVTTSINGGLVVSIVMVSAKQLATPVKFPPLTGGHLDRRANGAVISNVKRQTKKHWIHQPIGHAMQPIKLLAVFVLSCSLISTSGCDSLQSLFSKKGKKTKLTKAEIKRMIKESEKDLPHRLDENFTLTKITLDYGGTLNGWYTVSDDLTAKLRRVGNLKIEEKMRENIEKIDLDDCDVPEEIQQILEQDDFAIQYILEDKYGLPIASVVVSKETMDGEQRIGRTQQNPFAVRNVSKNGGK